MLFEELPRDAMIVTAMCAASWQPAGCHPVQLQLHGIGFGCCESTEPDLILVIDFNLFDNVFFCLTIERV